jgi:hypothetical protein
VGTAAPECKGTFPKGGPFHLVFTKRHIDNGDSLLVIALGDATAAAAPGEWLLEIRSAAVPEGGEMHCWIERSQGVPSSFLNHSDEEMTLSIPGTASSVIAVGAKRLALLSPPVIESPERALACRQSASRRQPNETRFWRRTTPAPHSRDGEGRCDRRPVLRQLGLTLPNWP